MKRKLFAGFLAAVLVLSLLPTAALATDTEPTVISENTTWNDAKTLTGNLTVNSGVTLTIKGQITINGNVTISGGGTIKRGNGYTDAMVTVPSGATLTLERITIDGGAVWGTPGSGAIEQALKRGITNSGLSATSAAILVSGKLIMQDATVQNNAATTAQGGIYLQSGSNMDMRGGAVKNNQSTYGAGIVAYQATLNLCGGTISGNYGTDSSGGLRLRGGPFVIKNAEIVNNAAGSYLGGGIYVNSADSTMVIDIVDSQIKDNYNLGIYNVLKSESLLILKNVTFSGNKYETGSDVVNKDIKLYNGAGMYAERTTFSGTIGGVGTSCVAYFSGTIPTTYDNDLCRAITNGGVLTSNMTYKENTLATPIKEGYTFGGWYDNESFTGSVVAAPTSGQTYYAKWTYEVKFDGNGATSGTMTEQTVTDGDKTTTLSTNIFVKTGYTFNGWNTAADGSGTTYAATKVASDVPTGTTLYAQWKPNEYTITYELNGGTAGANAPAKHTYGTDTELVAPTRTGYTFDGWYTDSELSTKVENDELSGTQYTENINLYAKWTANDYNITYVLNGGTAGADAPAKHTYGTDTTLVAPTKTGYTFGGWYTDESMVNVVSDNKLAGNGYTADIKLYAKWIPHTYTVKFNANGGEGTMDNHSMTYDAPASLAASSFTKPGYNFAGWDTDESADAVVYSDKTQVENLTATNGETVNLYAVWTPKKVCNPDVSVQTKTYNSKAQAFTLDDYNISYIQGDQIIENPIDAGSYDVVITRDEDETYAAYSTTVSGGLVINPQALIIKANDQSVRVGNALPEFSYTVTGLCGEDELSTEPAMTCTAADANTTGTYTITPSGADAGSNYTIVYEDGTLTVYKKHKSKSSGTDETNTDDKDNSGTTTVTDDKTGTVTETVKNTDGSTTVIETQKDGTMTTTDTAKNGVKTVTVAKPDENVKASVTLPSGVTSAKVTVPVKANSGTVAVDAKTGEVIKLSIPADDGLSLKLDNSADLIVINKSRNFADTKGHWALNGIDFATSHELFAGTGSETFEPDNSMTRAMLMTVLARFDGEDTNGGATWYEKSMGWAKGKGISDGSDPNGSITREELATMMWRYAGSPAVSGDLSKFSDSKNISAYAKDALIWAASEGLITGTTNDKIAPQGYATRAQVATIFMRYVKNLIG